MKETFMSFVILISLFSPFSASAEYRVFLLKISKKIAPPATNPSPADTAPAPSEDRILESTLDPEQYRSYYPIKDDEQISYIDTWRCYGRTDGGAPHCPKPQRQPSSATNNQNPGVNPASPP